MHTKSAEGLQIFNRSQNCRSPEQIDLHIIHIFKLPKSLDYPDSQNIPIRRLSISPHYTIVFRKHCLQMKFANEFLSLFKSF